MEGPVTWEDCTDRVDYNQGDQLLYMEPLYNFLLCVLYLRRSDRAAPTPTSGPSD